LKKRKKVVDIPRFGWYISQALERDATEIQKAEKKVLGKTKKVLDKQDPM